VKNYTVRRFQSQDTARWNAFIQEAKNATFLLNRGFMEYHADRFVDESLLVFDEEAIVSVLPANRVGNTLYSHQGLTYGGFVFKDKSKLSDVIAIVRSVLCFLHENNGSTLKLKLIPSIYTTSFAEEVEYTLFLLNAALVRRDCLSVIDLTKEFHYSSDRKQGVKRGEKNELEIREENSFEAFWNSILIPNLEEKHEAKPVHSLEEIQRLKTLFPANIRQFNVYHQGELVAGTTIFVSKAVAHSQYISGNSTKNQLGSLDFLHHHLINEVFKDKQYFDFGTSHEANGRKINAGLLYWKESFGAKTTVQDFYEINTAHFSLLDDVLL
jgi:hypothetical protein